MKISKPLFRLFILITGIILSYVGIGFLFPDPFYVSNYQFLMELMYLWLPILIQILYSVLVILIIMKNRRMVQKIGLPGSVRQEFILMDWSKLK